MRIQNPVYLEMEFLFLFLFWTIDNHMFVMSMMSDGKKPNTRKTILFSRV